MDYTTTEVPTFKQRTVCKALCPELMNRQITEYLDLLARDKWEKEAPKRLAEETYDKAHELLEEKKVGTLAEGRNLVLLNDAIEKVNTDVDLTPKPLGIRRNIDLPVLIPGSVVKPGFFPLDQEGKIVYQYEVDRDCDQIRAMIKIFLDEGEWTQAQFCRAAGGLTRKQLTAFMNKRGQDKAQSRLKAYLLSWEFFNFRDALGLPLRGANIAKDVAAVERQKGVPNGRKRTNAQADTEKAAPKAKRQKKNNRAPLQEIVNEADDDESDDSDVGDHETLEELWYRQLWTYKPGRTYVVVGARE
jgi:hypothetical protein